MNINKSTKQFSNKEIPADWEILRLNDVCSHFKSGTGITSQQITDTGLYPVFGGNGLRGYTETFTHDGDFLLIGRQGALCGNIQRISFKAYISEHAIAVQTKKDHDITFLAYKLEYTNLNRLSESSAQPGLAVEKLIRLKFNFPSLPEQKAIASVLSTWDNAIHKTEQLITQKELRKKWLMQQLLTGKKRLKGFDGEWEEVKLGDLIKLSSGDTKPNLTEKEYSEASPFPVYGGNGIMSYSNEFNSENEKIIIGRVGEYCGITRLITGKCWITDNALYTTDVAKSVSIHFLIYKLKYEDLSKLRSIGGQPLVSQKPIYNLSFIIPNSLKEQTAIAEVLQAADKEITLLRAKADKLREQKKGLMQMLLTGKKRLKI
jgi:type I restriction enzyme, S subunit